MLILSSFVKGFPKVTYSHVRQLEMTKSGYQKRDVSTFRVSWGKMQQKMRSAEYFLPYVNSLIISYMATFLGHFYRLAQRPILYFQLHTLVGSDFQNGCKWGK